MDSIRRKKRVERVVYTSERVRPDAVWRVKQDIAYGNPQWPGEDVGVQDIPRSAGLKVCTQESMRSETQSWNPWVGQQLDHDVKTSQSVNLSKTQHVLAGRKRGKHVFVVASGATQPAVSTGQTNERNQSLPASQKRTNFFTGVSGFSGWGYWKQAIVLVALLGILGTGTFSMVQKGSALKGMVLGMSTEGVDQVHAAVESIKQKDFHASDEHLASAAEQFKEASDQLGILGGTVSDVARFIPGASKLASGKYALEAGEHLANAGRAFNTAASDIWQLKEDSGQIPILDAFNATKHSVEQALSELEIASVALDKVNVMDIPSDKREKFVMLKEQLPTILVPMKSFLDNSAVLTEVFGGNGPRKYLFLLQNNQEMRATGGFIGTYALLDISNGRVRKFFMDGVFNPDGQLTAEIVPPQPIQKISGAWSLHDSNWFPDFPVSARKAIAFYEKTGGPTVDGVITLTPVVVQKLLEATGPVTLDDYGVTLDDDNFLALIQDQVEFKYGKEENKPKKILADLVPVLLDRIVSIHDVGMAKKLLQILDDSLKEKHILLYASNSVVEGLIQSSGWSGEIEKTDQDYLSIVNTNINGFKTDGVIDESIDHEAVISEDGTVTDTVTITRKHTGGKTGYDFWDRVNADYMRVYVPAGSKLISAEGQTRETVTPLLDYDALRFTRDPDVTAEEAGMKTDDKTGTKMYNEAGKTVFANWIYTSPGETTTIRYVYQLPFHIGNLSGSALTVGSYGVLVQKQAGSVGSKLASSVRYPENQSLLWQTPGNLVIQKSEVRFEGDLRTDVFYGIVLGD